MGLNGQKMAAMIIKRDSINFLEELSKNNNREWFNKHKDRYTEARNNIIAFADALIVEMNKHDKIETKSGKDSIFRIYKDVRFSKDKTPYNTHWSGSLKRATKKLRGGYYFRIEPGNSFVAGGFFGPESNDMKRIREDIDVNYKDWRNLLADPTLIKTFGKMIGEQIASTPRGYAKDNPAIDLLRYKQFLFKHEFIDQEVCGPEFLFQVNDVFKKMRPFFDYMSEVLTTDANGISVVD
jgi:uncharacterized protein (TIGR02453 family)